MKDKKRTDKVQTDTQCQPKSNIVDSQYQPTQPCQEVIERGGYIDREREREREREGQIEGRGRVRERKKGVKRGVEDKKRELRILQRTDMVKQRVILQFGYLIDSQY